MSYAIKRALIVVSFGPDGGHLIVVVVERFYAVEAGPCGMVGCNNLGGLNKSKEKRRKIPSSAKYMDVLLRLAGYMPH